MDRKITIELVGFGQVKEYRIESAETAKEFLSKDMNAGWRWRIQPPQALVVGDERRYAADCKACGVSNPFANC